MSRSSSLFIHSSLLDTILLWVVCLIYYSDFFPVVNDLQIRPLLRALPPPSRLLCLYRRRLGQRHIYRQLHSVRRTSRSPVIHDDSDIAAGRSILESIYCFSSSHGAFSRVGDHIDLLRSFQHSSVLRSPVWNHCLLAVFARSRITGKASCQPTLG